MVIAKNNKPTSANSVNDGIAFMSYSGGGTTGDSSRSPDESDDEEDTNSANSEPNSDDNEDSKIIETMDDVNIDQRHRNLLVSLVQN